MPTLYPTTTRLRLLEHIRDGQVIATREDIGKPWVFVDLGVPTRSGGQLVTSNIEQMLNLVTPWISVEETADRREGSLQLTPVGVQLLGASNPAEVVGL